MTRGWEEAPSPSPRPNCLGGLPGPRELLGWGPWLREQETPPCREQRGAWAAQHGALRDSSVLGTHHWRMGYGQPPGSLDPEMQGRPQERGPGLPHGRAPETSGTLCGLFPPLPARCLGSTSWLPCPGEYLVQGKARGLPSTLRSLAPHLCLGSSIARTENLPVCVCMCNVGAYKGVRAGERLGTCICRCRGEGVLTAEGKEKALPGRRPV